MEGPHGFAGLRVLGVSGFRGQYWDLGFVGFLGLQSYCPVA